MDLRRSLEIIKRNAFLIAWAALAAGLAAGLLSAVRTPLYRSSATVLIHPPDTTDALFAGARQGGSQGPFEADRRVAGQIEIIKSFEVLRAAASALGEPTRRVAGRVTVSQRASSDIVAISATDLDRRHAGDVANAVADAYLANRRERAVSQLRSAVKEVNGNLDELQRTIARYDSEIVTTTGTAAGTTGAPSQPVPQVPAPGANQAPEQPYEANPDDGSRPTTLEGRKAARYAAAVQFNSLFAKQQELLVQIGLKQADAELVSAARTPSAPVSPKPVRDGILGAMLGLLVGAGIGFFRDHLDVRVRTGAELESITGLPVLAELPFDGDDHQELATVSDPRGGFAEATRALRTSIEFRGLEAPVHVLAITSASPGDGKSRVAANLAAAYAQAGHRTIIVSADLRRPGLEKIFPAGASAGLTGVLASLPATRSPHSSVASDGTSLRTLDPGPEPGRAAEGFADRRRNLVAAALVETGVEGLLILPAGALPPNPAELLGSVWADDLLATLRELADVVVFDTPPLLAVTDAAVLAAKVDGVALVASVDRTSRDAVHRARQILDGTRGRVLGVVANRSPQAGTTYYYGRYHQEPERRSRLRRSPSKALAGADPS